MAGGESSAKRLTVSQITSDVQPRCFQRGESYEYLRLLTDETSYKFCLVILRYCPFLQAHVFLYRVSQCKSDHLNICLIYDCTKNLLREKWSNLKVIGVSLKEILYFLIHRLMCLFFILKSIKVLVVGEDNSFERYFNLNFVKFDVRRERMKKTYGSKDGRR